MDKIVLEGHLRFFGTGHGDQEGRLVLVPGIEPGQVSKTLESAIAEKADGQLAVYIQGIYQVYVSVVSINPVRITVEEIAGDEKPKETATP